MSLTTTVDCIALPRILQSYLNSPALANVTGFDDLFLPVSSPVLLSVAGGQVDENTVASRRDFIHGDIVAAALR